MLFANHLNKEILKMQEYLKAFDKVIVHEKTKVDGHYRQTVEIVYNFVGAIDRPIWGDELDENN